MHQINIYISVKSKYSAFLQCHLFCYSCGITVRIQQNITQVQNYSRENCKNAFHWMVGFAAKLWLARGKSKQSPHHTHLATGAHQGHHNGWSWFELRAWSVESANHRLRMEESIAIFCTFLILCWILQVIHVPNKYQNQWYDSKEEKLFFTMM